EDVVIAKLGDGQELSGRVAQLRERFGPAVALVHLAALRQAAEVNGFCPKQWKARRSSDVESLFHLAKALRSDLERAATEGGAAVLAATSLGGTFAVDGLSPPMFAGQGGIAGLVKTLALEWPTIRAKVVDLGPDDADAVASALCEELVADDGH